MARVDYQARILPGSGYIEKTRPTELSLGLYQDHALVAPSSGTISVFNDAGQAVVDGESVTITSSVSFYTVSTLEVANESYGVGWRIEWSLTMPDGFVHHERQEASLVRTRPSIPITYADLIARLPDIAEQGVSDFDEYINEAHREVIGKLEAKGRRPYLVISSAALRQVYLYTCLANICDAFAGSGDVENRWRVDAEKFADRARQEWLELALVYDEDDDGKDDGTRRRSGVTTVWLGGRP